MTIQKNTFGQTGQIITRYSQDLTPILDKAKEESKIAQVGDTRKIASLPETVLYQWGIEDFNDRLAYFNKWKEKEVQLKLFKRLNSPEFKNLRVWQGQLGVEDTNK
jgi:hypothetical protein